MSFIEPVYLYLLPLLLPAAIALFVAAQFRRRRLLRACLGGGAVVYLSSWRRCLRLLLLLGVFTFLLLAAARPHWGTRPIPAANARRDIVVLFDVSRSMLAADVPPSRLRHAKLLLDEVVAGHAGDRFALVPFAGQAYLMCPLTADLIGFKSYVDELSPDTIPLGGTDLEAALTVAATAFEAAAGGHRAVLLLTDGEALSGDSHRAVEQLKEQEIPLLVAGFGDPAVPALIPDGDGGYRRDRQGELVQTRLAEDELRQLALATGGLYVRSTAAEPGVEVLSRRIRALTPERAEGGIRSVPIERFPWFLAAAGILFFAFLLIHERGRATTVLTLAVLLLAGSALPAADAEAPVTLPEETAVPAAEEETRDDDPDPVALYNRALAKQQAGEQGFETLYEQSVRSGGPGSAARQRSFLNLGVDRHRVAREKSAEADRQLETGRLDQAETGLKQALATLEEALRLYGQAAAGEAGAPALGQNLRRLDADRRRWEAQLKRIEELRKQQQQARQETQQAKQQNQQSQQQDQQQDQQQQNQQDQQQDQQSQQNQQDQQQDQQSQQNQQPSPPGAAEQMRRAQEAAEELRRQAEELKQQRLGEQAKQAAEEIEKAREAAARQDRAEADRRLEEALQKLGRPKEEPPQQEPSPAERQDGEAEAKEGENDRPLEPPPAGEGKEQGEQGEQTPQLDRATADQLLQEMADREKRLREAIQARQRAGRRTVEKDW